MTYKMQKPRKKFNLRMNEDERHQLQKVMQHENIPDEAKTIRYLINQAADQIRQEEGEK